MFWVVFFLVHDFLSSMLYMGNMEMKVNNAYIMIIPINNKTRVIHVIKFYYVKVASQVLLG